MSRSVCPWCQNPYVENEDGVLVCKNTDCRACAEEFLHEELDRTKKNLDDLQKDYDLAIQHAKTMTETCLEYKNKLDIAVDALEEAREEIGKIKNNDCPCGKPHIWFTIDNALEQIKDKDKDVK